MAYTDILMFSLRIKVKETGIWPRLFGRVSAKPVLFPFPISTFPLLRNIERPNNKKCKLVSIIDTLQNNRGQIPGCFTFLIQFTFVNLAFANFR